MSYIAHEWQNGEIITANKLNNIEEGIQEAAQSSGNWTATIKISAASGFSSASHQFGYIVYAYKGTNDEWIIANDELFEWPNLSLYGFTEPNIRLAVVPLPSDNDVGAFLVAQTGALPNLTGSISTTPERLYFSYGSYVNGDGFRITGNGTAEFVSD